MAWSLRDRIQYKLTERSDGRYTRWLLSVACNGHCCNGRQS